MPRLFVYGTLRPGGYYHRLLSEAKLVEKEVIIKGYELRDSGLYYPYAFEEVESQIIGDIFEVSQELLEGPLDELEDTANSYYKRFFDTHYNLYIYLKMDENKTRYKLIESGDWIKYWKEQEKKH